MRQKAVMLVMAMALGLLASPLVANINYEIWDLDVLNTEPTDSGRVPTDFSELGASLVTGTLNWFGLGPRDPGDFDDYITRLTGYITIPEDGTYTFVLRSDDGSLLWIGDWWGPEGPDPLVPRVITSLPLQKVVDFDGPHGMTGPDLGGTSYGEEGKTGTIELPAGTYGIMVQMFESSGGDGLEVGTRDLPQAACNPYSVPAIEYEIYNGVPPTGYIERFNADQPSLAQLDLYNVSGSMGSDPVLSGMEAGFTIWDRKGTHQFTYVFRAILEIEQAGDYAFYTSSDDGSMLYLGNWWDGEELELVVDNDGWHGTGAVSGIATLEPGYVGVVVTMFEDTGGHALTVEMDGPGIPRGPIPNSMLRGRKIVSDPSPASGARDVPTTVTLSWEAPVDANEPHFYEVYMGVNDANEANFSLLATDLTETSLEVTDLAYGTPYFWVVDVMEPNMVGTQIGVVRHRGAVASFMTEMFTAQPQSVTAGLGCSAVLEVSVADPTATIEWFKDGVSTGMMGSTLTLSDISYDDAGDYVAVATNAFNSVASDVATVSVPVHGVEPEHQDVSNDPSIRPGNLQVDGGTYTVTGAGADIWGDNDQFHFVFVEMSGDCEIVARVVAIDPERTGDSDWQKAGVMIRDSLDAWSTHHFMAITSRNGSAWQGRMVAQDFGTPDSELEQQSVSTGPWGGEPIAEHWGPTEPVWVKLTRTGDTFQAYISMNGKDWSTAAGNDGLRADRVMTDPVYVGLAVTSHNAGQSIKTVFDNVVARSATKTAFGVSWDIVNLAVAPGQDPDTGWIDPTVDQVLTWEPAPGTPCDAVYTLYASSDPEITEDDKLAETGDTTLVVPAGMMDYEQTWYVRIDVSSATADEPDTGQVVVVRTIKRVPIIEQEPPDKVVVPEGDTLTLSLSATALPEVPITAYTWYKEGVAEALAFGNPADVVTDFDITDEGVYYCVVSNSAGDTQSASTRVELAKMIAHYDFESINEQPGDPNPTYLLPDVVGDNDGEVLGGAVLDVGIHGMALLCDGVDDQVQIGAVGIQGNEPRSITCWAKANVPAGSIADWTNIFGFTSTPDGGSYLSFDFNKMFGTEYGIHQYSAEQGMGVNTLDDQWHFLAATYDGTTVQRFFDGIYIGSFNPPDGLMTQDNVKMGRRGHDAGGFWNGLIDDARIYNYAISDETVGQLYTDVAGGTICVRELTYDVNGDCRVDLRDFAIMAEAFLTDGFIRPQ